MTISEENKSTIEKIKEILDKLPAVNLFNVFDTKTFKLEAQHSESVLEAYYDNVKYRENTVRYIGNGTFLFPVKFTYQNQQQQYGSNGPQPH